MQDCVNHPSRKHYPSGQTDRYFRIDTGVYRRYDPLNDLISSNSPLGSLLVPPLSRGRLGGGWGKSCKILKTLNLPHPHPNPPLEGEGALFC